MTDPVPPRGTVPAARILVVGAGIAGLSATIALRRTGAHVEMVERLPRVDPAGAGLLIPSNGMRAFTVLGLRETLLARGQVITRMRARNADATVEGVANLAEVWPNLPPCLAIHRVDLHRALLAAADVPVRFGVSPTTLSQTPAAVHVSFTDGTSAEYDLVVAADGVHSTVRARCLPDVHAGYGGESWWRTVVLRPPHLTDWTVALCAEGNLLALPIDRDRAYVAFGVTTEQPFADPSTGRAARLRERCADVSGVLRQVVDLVTDDDAVQFSPAHQVWIPEPVIGRVVLVGDAAHAATPHMAQGASMAAEDAIVLAEELARSTDGVGDDYAAALARYTARRAPRVRHVKETTAMRSRLAALPLAARLPAAAKFAELSKNSFAALVPEP